MGKQDITYSCGHEGTVNLYGKQERRDREVAALEHYGLCPECYQEKRRKEDKEMGIVGLCYVVPLSQEKKVWLILALTGDTYDNREVLKELKFSFSELFSPPGMDIGWKGFRAWFDSIPITSPEELEEGWQKYLERMDALRAALPAVLCTLRMEHCSLDEKAMEVIFEHHRKVKVELAKLTRPAVPEFIRGHEWNKKIYGHGKWANIYLDEEKRLLAGDEEELVRSYLEDWEDYCRRVKDIKQNGCLSDCHDKAKAARAEVKAALAEVVPPSFPEFIQGHEWNRKVYGSGKWTNIYLDGKKRVLDEEEQKELNMYLKDWDEYCRKLKDIKQNRKS